MPPNLFNLVATQFAEDPAGIAIRFVADIVDGFLLVDSAGRILYANQAAAEIAGLERSLLTGRAIQDLFVAPTNRHYQNNNAHLLEAIERGESIIEIELWVEVDGETHLTSCSVSVFQQDEQHLSIVLLRDNKRRFLTELALRQRQTALDVSQTLARLSHWRWQIATGEFSVSEKMALLLDLDTDDPLSYADVFRFANDVEQMEFESLWQECLQQEKPLEFRGTLKSVDGSVLHVEVFATIEYDPRGELMGFSGAIQDVTSRVGAAQALRSSEARLRAIFEGSNHGILMMGLDGTIIQSNQAFSTLIGYSGVELLGRRLNEFIVPDEEPKFAAELESLINDQVDTYFAMDGRLIGHETRVFWAELTISLIHDRDDEPHRLVAIVEDISQRQEMARELANIRHRLTRSRDQAQQALAQDLHDGPIQDLHAARFQLQVLRQHVESDAGRQLLEKTQDLFQHAIDSLRGMMGELRPPALAPFGLAAAIRSLTERFQELFPETTIHLDLVDDGQSLPEQLRLGLFRVNQEIMNNVGKHARAKNIWIELFRRDNEIVLKVTDDGAGFAPPRRLIDLARDGHLGLIGMMERVEEFNGSFDLQSTPGQGTHIQITAPLRSPKD